MELDVLLLLVDLKGCLSHFELLSKLSGSSDSNETLILVELGSKSRDWELLSKLSQISQGWLGETIRTPSMLYFDNFDSNIKLSKLL